MENNIKGAKVYVVVVDIAYNMENEINFNVFANEAEAIAEFDKLVKEEREEDHLYQTDYYMEEFDEQNHTFSVWKDGAYCEDHFCAHIETKIIH